MIYLDTNIIIYAIENHIKYGEKCKKILQLVQDNKLKVCCSILVLVEVINVLNKINKSLAKDGLKLNIGENIDALLTLPITWHDLNFLILKHSAKYDFNISGADYSHIATMEINSVYEIITADSDFDKVPFVKRIDPFEFTIK